MNVFCSMLMSMPAKSSFEHSKGWWKALRHLGTQRAFRVHLGIQRILRGHSEGTRALGHLTRSGNRALGHFDTWALRVLRHLGTQTLRALKVIRALEYVGTRVLSHLRHFIKQTPYQPYPSSNHLAGIHTGVTYTTLSVILFCFTLMVEIVD